MAGKLRNGTGRNALLVLHDFCYTFCNIRIRDFRLGGLIGDRNKVWDDMRGDLHIRFNEGSIEGEK